MCCYVFDALLPCPAVMVWAVRSFLWEMLSIMLHQSTVHLTFVPFLHHRLINMGYLCGASFCSLFAVVCIWIKYSVNSLQGVA